MFVRKVAALIKPECLPEFTRVMEDEIIPWLRQQRGFLDLITLAVPDGSEVTTLSFWDQEENAERYSTTGYPPVVEILAELLDGAPYVKTFNVVSSTLQRIAPLRPSQAENLQESDSDQLESAQLESAGAPSSHPDGVTADNHLAI